MKRARGVFYDEQRREWYWMCDAPGTNGKRRQVKGRGFAKMEEARDARELFRARIVAKNVPVPATDTVAGFAVAWIAALPAEGIEPATVKHYSECVNRVLPMIGDVRM